MKKLEKNITASEESKGKRYLCSVCGREITQEEYVNYDKMCWECWDDQLTEESDMMFGDLM